MILLPLHVTGGFVAIAAGFVALYALKGASLHRKSGTIFVYAMLAMALSGAVMAFQHAGTAVNVAAGLVSVYLVVTAVNTVQRPSLRSRRVDRAAALAAFAIGLITIAVAFGPAPSGTKNGAWIFTLVIFGTIALASGVGDLRMIRAGGFTGTRRLKRHLWRMCVALFIAAASFFLGPVRRIPEPLRIPALRLIPLVVLATMVYWLWTLRRKRIARTLGLVTAPEAI
jgi:uncharacterized membrane protein